MDAVTATRARRSSARPECAGATHRTSAVEIHVVARGPTVPTRHASDIASGANPRPVIVNVVDEDHSATAGVASSATTFGTRARTATFEPLANPVSPGDAPSPSCVTVSARRPGVDGGTSHRAVTDDDAAARVAVDPNAHVAARDEASAPVVNQLPPRAATTWTIEPPEMDADVGHADATTGSSAYSMTKRAAEGTEIFFAPEEMPSPPVPTPTPPPTKSVWNASPARFVGASHDHHAMDASIVFATAIVPPSAPPSRHSASRRARDEDAPKTRTRVPPTRLATAGDANVGATFAATNARSASSLHAPYAATRTASAGARAGVTHVTLDAETRVAWTGPTDPKRHPSSSTSGNPDPATVTASPPSSPTVDGDASRVSGTVGWYSAVAHPTAARGAHGARADADISAAVRRSTPRRNSNRGDAVRDAAAILDAPATAATKSHDTIAEETRRASVATPSPNTHQTGASPTTRFEPTTVARSDAEDPATTSRGDTPRTSGAKSNALRISDATSADASSARRSGDV